jgi:hypothetical protein
MPERLPHPGPGYLKPHEVRIGERRLEAAMAKPVDGPDDWWLAVLWVADDNGVVSFRDVAPVSGPPAEPPLVRLGPAFAGALSGLIREVDRRRRLWFLPLRHREKRSWATADLARDFFGGWAPADRDSVGDLHEIAEKLQQIEGHQKASRQALEGGLKGIIGALRDGPTLPVVARPADEEDH